MNFHFDFFFNRYRRKGKTYSYQKKIHNAVHFSAIYWHFPDRYFLMLTTFRGQIFFYHFSSLNGNMGAFSPCDMINEIIKQREVCSRRPVHHKCPSPWFTGRKRQFRSHHCRHRSLIHQPCFEFYNIDDSEIKDF